MSKRVFGNINWTPTATADVTPLANATYQAVRTSFTSAYDLHLEVNEIYIAGMAGASSPTFMLFARNITAGVTPTALSAPAYDGPLDPLATAPVQTTVTYTAAATGPQRSSALTSARLNLALNAFGGIVRWMAAPREDFVISSVAAPSGEASLSAYTGGTPGAVNSHIVYEQM
jgi:hypothetical protein